MAQRSKAFPSRERSISRRETEVVVSLFSQHQPALAEKQLVHLLPEWTFATQGIYAVYADMQHLSAKVCALIDFLRQWIV